MDPTNPHAEKDYIKIKTHTNAVSVCLSLCRSEMLLIFVNYIILLKIIEIEYFKDYSVIICMS